MTKMIVWKSYWPAIRKYVAWDDNTIEGRVFHLEVDEEAWSNNNLIIAEEISNGVVYMSGPVVFDNLKENKKVTQLCDFSYLAKTGAITHETEC